MNEDPELCPPHNFKAAWSNEQIGVMFCTLCGDVRPLTPPTIGPVIDETPIHTRGEGGSGR